MLLHLGQYISERGSANINELSDFFDMNPAVMRDRLAYWIKKGKLIQKTLGCQKSCSFCDTDRLEVYTWVQESQCASLIQCVNV